MTLRDRLKGKHPIQDADVPGLRSQTASYFKATVRELKTALEGAEGAEALLTSLTGLPDTHEVSVERPQLEKLLEQKSENQQESDEADEE